MSDQVLNVPYKSQYSAEDPDQRFDCGLCCISMILGAVDQDVAPADIAAKTGKAGEVRLSPHEVMQSAQAFELGLAWEKSQSLDDLKRYLDDGQPPIATLEYGKVSDRPDQQVTGTHYVLVVGYDDLTGQVLVNDSHHSPDTTAGYRRAYPYQTFLEAWGGFAEEEQNFGLLVPQLEQPVMSPEEMADIGVSFGAQVEPALLLNVPYKSQRNVDASGKHADCGPACVSMILGAIGQGVPTNEVIAASGMTEESGLSKDEIIAGAKAFDLEMSADKGFSLDDLRRFLNDGQPPIALIKYGKIPDRWDQAYTAGHYVVVVGYDDTTGQVFINDPNYPAGSAQGYQRAYPYEVFIDAWGGFNEVGSEEDYNFCLIIPRPAQPVPSTALPTSMGRLTPPPPSSIGDVWVSAPAGLWLHIQQDATADLSLPSLLFGQHLRALGPESTPDAGGHTWQEVRSARGLTGWVPASKNGERYLSSERPDEPHVVEVLDTPPVYEAGALNLYEARDTSSTVVDRVQIEERLAVYSRVAEADGTSWLWVKSPHGKYGWACEKADDTTLVGPVEEEEDLSDVSFTLPPGLGDVWVIAPVGLQLRTQLDTPPGPGAPTVSFGQRLRALSPESVPDEKARVWQQVGTEQGVIAWAPAKAGSDRYLLDREPEGPYIGVVLDTQPVRAAGGLSVRDTLEINSPLLDQIKVGERFTIYVHIKGADGTPWLWVKSPRGKYGWARQVADGVTLVDKAGEAVQVPTPAPVPSPAAPAVDVNPFGKCLVGLGTANPWPLQDPDYGVIATSNIELVKVLAPGNQAPGQGVDDVRRLMGEGRVVMGRLFEKPADRRMSAQEFVGSVVGGFEELYSVGVRYFEVHNEPNLPHDGLGVSWANGAEFGQWFIEVYNALKARHADALLGYPGLSPQFNNPGLPPEADTWKFLDGSEAAAQRADWIGVHCYWQNDGDGHWAILSELDGMLWKKFRARYPNKPIFITEFSNNGRHIDYDTKGEQYGRYFSMLRHEVNLAGAIGFALYWPGQDANREGWRTDKGGINAISGKVGSAVSSL